ncbi:MAG: polysaccharide deacetylase family protein [Clostridia bacterium]|nr:polysaccharide deacetylase family protein [Clostridia bacterium]
MAGSRRYSLLTGFTVLLTCILLLLSGCGRSAEPENKTDSASIYLYAYDGTSVQEYLKNVDSFSPNKMISALVADGVLGNEVEFKDFNKVSTNGNTIISLDLNAGYVNYLLSKPEDHQKATVQCVANTFLKNYGADMIVITSDGSPVKTYDCDFSSALAFNAFQIKTISAVNEDEAPVITEAEIPETTTEPETEPGYVPQKDRNDGKKHVAISFDDGPSAKFTSMIVDKLKEHNATASFFIVGNLVGDSNIDGMKYAVENGCEIQIHGWTHEVYYSTCSDETYQFELSETAKKIEEVVGKAPTLMRPFGGNITDERTANCQYPVVLWDVDSEDWKHKKDASYQVIVDNVMSNVRDGSIILMHEIYENSYKAFCEIIDRLYDEGYEVMSVSELFGSDNLKPGRKYYALDYVVDYTGEDEETAGYDETDEADEDQDEED